MSTLTTRRYDTSKHRAPVDLAEHSPALLRFTFANPFDWLPGLVGRSRALEILASGGDFDADTAERYGWINRSVADTELDAFVDSLASRIAGFDKQALATVKRLVNQRSAPPSEGDLLQSFRAISDAISWPAAQARIHLMEERGWGADTDTELNHAALVGELASQLAQAANHRAAPARSPAERVSFARRIERMEIS